MKTAWPIVKLVHVLTPAAREETVNAAKEYRLLGIRLEGQGPFLRETVLGTQTSASKLFRVAEGDFIYSRLFACRGAFGVIGKELHGCYVSAEFPTFVPVNAKIDIDFLRCWFRLPSVIDRVNEDCTGSTPLTRNRFKENFFLALEIPLPPLAEQQRIVARIEELAAQIQGARTLRHLSAQEVEMLVPCSTEKVFADAAKLFSSEPLGNYVKLQGGYAFKSDEYQETGLPIVRIANLENETVHTEGSPCMPKDRLDEFRRFVLSPGDILVAITGATTGKLGIVPMNCGTWLLNQRVGRFLPKKPDKLTPKYVYWLARGVQKHIFETAYGGAQPNISPSNIEEMKFPFPPLEEQRRVVAELDALQAEVDALKRLQAEAAAELDALLPAILDKAFKGEL